MSTIRPLASAVIIGASSWCAAGWLTVAAPDSPVLRLVAPASFRWFVVPALAALLVPAFRHRPSLAAPALLATLPWWPVPVPTVFLVWTGPMASVPIGLAFVCAVFAGRGRATVDQALGGVRPAAGVSPVLAGGLTLGLAVITAVMIDSRTPGGDEPHYLVITQSLLRDGDLRIENNHRNADYAEYYGGTLAPDFIQRGRDGEIYSIHAPGLSALVLPGFAVAGYRGAQATLLTLSAITGALVWLIGWQATGRRGAAWFAWAGVAPTATMLLQAGMVFPDAPGALAVAAGVWLVVRLATGREPVSHGPLFLTGILLASLPWLHTRFAVLAAGLGILVVWRLWSDAQRRVTGFVAFLAVPALAAIAWVAFFWLIYGTPNPAAPYGADSGARLAYVPGGMLAILFDQQFGLLAYSPVLACAVYGLAVAGRSGQRAVAWTSAAVAVIYTAVVATYWMWWAGVPATPARFLTAVLPVAALPLAIAWAAADRARQLLCALLAISLATAAVTVGVGQGSLAWNTRNAEAAWLEWLGPVVNLPRAWPSFFWRLSPDDLSTELPFLLHAIVFAGAITVSVALALWLARRRAAAAPATQPWLAWAFSAGLMAAAMAGWQLNGVSGLDPARSQLALATRVGEGASSWRIAPWQVVRDPDVAMALRIQGEEPGRTDAPPPWAVLTDVPPGRYEVRVATDHRAGRLVVKLGRSPSPMGAVPIDGNGAGRATIGLPAGARVLVIDSEPPTGGRQGVVELRPVALDRPVERLAQSRGQYGNVDVFFLDSAVYVEPAGFWVRGSSTAEWLLAATPGQTPVSISMVVQNGGSPNDVVVSLDGVEQAFSLSPSDARRIDVPLTGPSSTAHVRVRSASGFRPSDVGESEDRRFLGVWIEIEGDGSRSVPLQYLTAAPNHRP